MQHLRRPIIIKDPHHLNPNQMRTLPNNPRVPAATNQNQLVSAHTPLSTIEHIPPRKLSIQKNPYKKEPTLKEDRFFKMRRRAVAQPDAGWVGKSCFRSSYMTALAVEF